MVITPFSSSYTSVVCEDEPMYKVISVQDFLLPAYDQLRKQAIEIILESYPQGDEQEFLKFLNSTDNILYLLHDDRHLLCMMGQKPIEGDAVYLDWLLASSHAKGCTHQFFNRIHEGLVDTKIVAAAKPHVATFWFCMQLGYAVHGITKTGEYKHHYACMRCLPQEQGRYLGPNLTQDQIGWLASLVSVTPCSLKNIECGNSGMAICTVEYRNVTACDDLRAGGPQGEFLQIIAEQAKLGNVLTAYHLLNKWQGFFQYLAVFEKSCL